MHVSVLGAGSWGTALASVLAETGHEVMLWARNPETVAEIGHEHTNKRYFPDSLLPPTLTATNHLEEALSGTDLIVYAVPSKSVRQVAHQANQFVPNSVTIAHAIKGFDLSTLTRISEVLEEEHPAHVGQICAIAGPSHAEEVISHLPTTIVAASKQRSVAEYVQDALMSRYLRVYTQADLVGAELGGSLKNIIAVATGISDGLGFGDNAKAALMTRGLAEIARLGHQMGASVQTFAGLTGIGDLIATCTSRHSRNLRAGRLIGQGMSVADAETSIGMVVEGIPATQATVQLANKYGVDMPITTTLHSILYEGANPLAAVEPLMSRAKRHETELEGSLAFW